MRGYCCRQGILLVFLACCLCLGALAAADDLREAKSDFLAGNPNDGWTFGFIDKTGAFVAYNTTFKVNESTVGWCLDDMPGVFGDITMCFDETPLDKFGIRWETGQLCVNPGLDCQGVVIRWTAPEVATVKIEGKLKGVVKNGGKTSVRVSKDDATLVSGAVAGEDFVEARSDALENAAPMAVGASSSVPSSAELSTSVAVTKGDTIDFVFVRDGEIGGGHVGFDLTMQATGASGKVSYNPSPVGIRTATRVASANTEAR